MQEETAKPLPLSDEDSGDENESLCSHISDLMYDIIENEISGCESDLNDPTHLPKWADSLLRWVKHWKSH